MRLTYFGGPAWDAGALPVRGRGQEALLLRLALDAGTVVGYRALAEDVWQDDLPDDPRAALQSLVSRVRKALPGVIDAASGGYRLALARGEVDLTAFQDLVALARTSDDADAARAALALWTGDPWLPDGFDWALRDLLEDRAHAERIVRASEAVPAPGAARTSTPPAAASDAALHPGIPAALTPLIGRGPELDAVAAQLDESRLVTILGPGGAGKTTLAVETARRHPGAVIVELAPTTPDEVWNAIAGAAGRTMRLTETGQHLTARDRALTALAGRDALIVLDNCEHVSAAAADAAVTLLQLVPGARILATSREPLGVAGEAFVPLGPLPEQDARELFARRVRAASGAEPDDVEAADRIVRRLDGLPLALELAAAKTRTLTLAEIEAGLDDRFALLASGPRTADPRHQTLRALIDWSWEMLTDPERIALRGLAVFPDGVLARDAATVARHLGTTADAFDALVDRSLLHRSVGRFRMLETVREYGIDLLRAASDDDRVRLQAARATAELAIATDPLLRGHRVREAIAWYDANEENLSAALRTAEASGDQPLGIRLLRGAMWAWTMRERFGALTESVASFTATPLPLDDEPTVVVFGLALLMTVFESPPGEDRPDEATREHFHATGARLAEASARHPSELSRALPPLVRAFERTMEHPDPHWSRTWAMDLDDIADPEAPAWTQALLALLRTAFAQNSGNVDVLGRESATALAGFRALGDPWGTALSSQMRAEWLVLQGRLDEALDVADAAVIGLQGLTSIADLLQQQSTAVGILARLGRFAEAHDRLGAIEVAARADGSARAMLQFHFTAASLAIAEGDGALALGHLSSPETTIPPRAGEAQFRAWVDIRRAQAMLLAGRPDSAAPVLRDALTIARASGDHPIIADALLTLAWWLAVTEQPDAARRAFGHAVRVRGRADVTEPVYRLGLDLIGDPVVADEGTDDELDALILLAA